VEVVGKLNRLWRWGGNSVILGKSEVEVVGKGIKRRRTNMSVPLSLVHSIGEKRINGCCINTVSSHPPFNFQFQS